MDTRSFINSLGGYRAVADRIGKSPTTVHTHLCAGSLPAAWYFALCKMAKDCEVKKPARSLFSFLELSEGDTSSGVAA